MSFNIKICSGLVVFDFANVEKRTEEIYKHTNVYIHTSYSFILLFREFNYKLINVCKF